MERDGSKLPVWSELIRDSTTVALGASLLVGSAACSALFYQTDSVLEGSSYQVNDFNDACEIVPEGVINETSNLFRHSEPGKDKPKWEVAKGLGLTVYDFTHTKYERFMRATYELYDDEVSINESISVARDFLELYDIELIVTASDKDIRGQIQIRPYTQDDIDSVNQGRLKRQLVDFIHSLSSLPVELVHYMGMRRVVFAHGPIHNGVVSTSAGFVDPSDPDLSTVYINPNLPNDGILLHEMFHLWDMKECGPDGASEDEQYAAFNPTDNIYENQEGYRSVESEWSGSDGHNVAVMRDYGFFSVVEDKATMGVAILTPFHLNRIFNVYNSPVLENKALLLLSRINNDRPEIAEYLALTYNDK